MKIVKGKIQDKVLAHSPVFSYKQIGADVREYVKERLWFGVDEEIDPILDMLWEKYMMTPDGYII